MKRNVGMLFGTRTLDAMYVYIDENGLFITKTTTGGMCGTEYRNVYFAADSIISIDGLTYSYKPDSIWTRMKSRMNFYIKLIYNS